MIRDAKEVEKIEEARTASRALSRAKQEPIVIAPNMPANKAEEDKAKRIAVLLKKRDEIMAGLSPRQQADIVEEESDEERERRLMADDRAWTTHRQEA